MQFVTAAGKTWLFNPQVGNLTSVDAGFSSILGMFTASYQAHADGFSYTFSAPAGTSGSVSMAMPASCNSQGSAVLTQQENGREWWECGTQFQAVNAGATVNFSDLAGGNYTVRFQCGQYPVSFPVPGWYPPGHRFPSGTDWASSFKVGGW